MTSRNTWCNLIMPASSRVLWITLLRIMVMSSTIASTPHPPTLPCPCLSYPYNSLNRLRDYYWNYFIGAKGSMIVIILSDGSGRCKWLIGNLWGGMFIQAQPFVFIQYKLRPRLIEGCMPFGISSDSHLSSRIHHHDQIQCFVLILYQWFHSLAIKELVITSYPEDLIP